MITSLVPTWLAQETTDELDADRPQLERPARAVLLLDRRRHVADPRRLHGVRGRRLAAQEPHVDGDEEHPHDRRRHPDVLLLRLVHLRLLRAGLPEHRPGLADGHAGPEQFPGFCGQTAPWADEMGPNLAEPPEPVFFLAFLLFSWTTASIMSGALIERVRLSAFLILGSVLGSVVWIMDAAWGWSSGGWLTTSSASTTRSRHSSCTVSRAHSRSACC